MTCRDHVRDQFPPFGHQHEQCPARIPKAKPVIGYDSARCIYGREFAHKMHSADFNWWVNKDYTGPVSEERAMDL